ncbi:Shedu anti-phage system protein SduA domain-containing protein [Micromonospora sp. NPDC049175]|uniref:Shedu anti-phage system protein SduA domain-containing protein n=1 Tax=Micromonospora sp. NPDC049175 TaxID=3364266 RepID=UPI0037179F80
MTDDPATQAIRAFWQDRQAPTAERRLTPGGDAITGLLTDMLVGHGVSQDAVRPRQAPKLPGGYGLGNRRWDLLVVDDELPIAAIEVKAMTGTSIGHNMRNRQEEIVAVATDFARTYRLPQVQEVKPFVGLVLIVEDNEVSARLRRSPEPTAGTSPMSYQEQIRTFLSRIVKDGLYDAVWFVVTAPPPHFTVAEPDSAFGFEHFSRTAAERIRQIRAADDDATAFGKTLADHADIEDILSGITSTPRGLSAAEASVIQRRRDVVAGLQSLALEPATTESAMQAAISRNYWLFGGQYIAMAPRSIVPLDQYDIPLVSADGSLHVVELKGPAGRLVREHRGSLIVADEVHEAVSQCLNYLRSLDETGATLQTLRQNEGRPAYDFRRSRATVIIGHPDRAVTDAVSRTRIEQTIRSYNAHLSRIQVLTYADLLDGAERALRFEEESLD